MKDDLNDVSIIKKVLTTDYFDSEEGKKDLEYIYEFAQKTKNQTITAKDLINDNVNLTPFLKFALGAIKEISNGNPDFLKKFPANDIEKKKTDAKKLMESLIKNQSVALTNTPNRKDSNDKVSRVFFTPTDTQVDNKSLLVKVGEMKRGKEKGQPVKVDINWNFDENFLKLNPQLTKFDAFDKEVILACISEYVTHTNKGEKKHYITTLESIYRAMVGDDGSDNRRKSLYPKTLEKIKQSIDKARFCNLTIDLTDACKKFCYNNGKPIILQGYVLPVVFADGYIVNGQATTVLKFLDISPLFTAAELQNGQILTYDKKMLAIPTVNNTEDVIRLKGYIFRRVLEIIAHKMTPTLVLNTVFEETGFDDLNRDKKRKLLTHIEKFFDYWLEINKIKSYFFLDKKGQRVKGAEWREIAYENNDGEMERSKEIYRPKLKNANLGIYSITFTY